MVYRIFKVSYRKVGYNNSEMTFNEWLLQEIERSGLSNSEIARRGGISHARISQVLAGQNPGADFCIGIARGLGLIPEDVLRRAGILPPLPPAVAEEREVVGLLRRLGASMRETAVAILRTLAGQPPEMYTLRERGARYAPPDEEDPAHALAAEQLARQLMNLRAEDQQKVIELMERLQAQVEGETGREPDVSLSSSAI